MSHELDQQAIRELAYTKWEQAGCPPGDGCSFWLEAEQELLSCSQDSAQTNEECCTQLPELCEVKLPSLKKAS